MKKVYNKALFIITLLLILLFLPVTVYAATFTPGMAKRSAPGPFTAAPIVQGDYTGKGDLLYGPINKGGQISSEFYEHLDLYQGSIVFWFTPEWDGDDGLNHLLLEPNVNSLRFTKNTSNQLQFFLGTGSVAHTVDISSWTAGTTYQIVARWDTKSTLDGTNNYSISINDSHSFGGSTGTFSMDLAQGLLIGSYPLTVVPRADAIIEGLTIYRRPLFDGTYGVDVGNGDEIAKIYDSDENNGNGITPQDPTLVTGSWDVVFALPTNSSTGALVTGTGEAWSHPHSSSVLTDTFAQSAYAGSGWSDEGTPIAPESVEFDGGTDINVGSDGSLDNLHDNAVTWEGWFRISDDVTTYQRFFNKSAGVLLRFTTSSLGLFIYTDGSNSIGGTSTDVFPKGKWFHLAATYDDAGDRKGRIYVNGVLVSIGSAATGTITDDSANDLLVGLGLIGGGGWARVSDNIRYTTTFTPPSRTTPPATDGNTVEQWNLNDGSGTTATAEVSSPTNDGTISNGTWNTVKDMATDAPGERVFNWGYSFGVDAANEGITQTLSGLDAGQNYVIRTLAHTDTADDIRIRIWDETNNAQIGTDFDFGASSSSPTPGVGLFTFELPTVARNSVAADSTSISVKVLGTASGQTVYVHQVELQENLIDNPSLETGSGDPWIPDGWTNGLAAGDSTQETTNIHSGNSAIKLNTAATGGRFIQKTHVGTVGNFYSSGAHVYESVDTGKVAVGGRNFSLTLQASSSTERLASPGGALWKSLGMVLRSRNVTERFVVVAISGATGDRFADDAYYFPLDDVSLTVTPASEANSTESTGVRVDGGDLYTDTISGFTATDGYVSFDWTPRHDGAKSSGDFGISQPMILRLYKDNDNYISVRWSSDDTIQILANSQGVGFENQITAVTGITAGTTYRFSLIYSASHVRLFIDDVEKVTLTMVNPIDFGSDIPDIAYIGSSIGVNQADATYDNILFDTAAPSISLTALSPDPSSDTTPSLTGTATDALGTSIIC